jgi:LSD1 subclass zinc finger protein
VFESITFKTSVTYYIIKTLNMNEESVLSETTQKDIVCKGCSGKLQFEPGTNHLKCPYCGMENEIEITTEVFEELDFEKFVNEFEKESTSQEVATIKCQGCGTQTTFNPNVVADSCPCCGSPLVVKDATSTHTIKPKALLPFAIDQNKAFEDFRTWINKLWFAPNKLKKYAQQQEKLTGLYIPYWTYDSKTSTDYQGERGDDYQTTETYTVTENGQSVTKTRSVTHTRWSSVSGHVDNIFDDVLVVASKSLPKEYVEKLEPWGLENMVPFNERYLSGFKTESYQVDLKEGLDDAKIKMNDVINSAVCKDIGGDHQRIHSLNTVYNNITFKHILLPIWISAYLFKDKVYRFLINGRTGEVQGERPYSWIKITLTALAAAAIILIIVIISKK